MIWNEEILFLHIPRSGGTSVARALHRRLKGSVFSTVPQPEKLTARRWRRQAYRSTGLGPRDITFLHGRHETLAQAVKILAAHERSLEDFERIAVISRSPYEIELSRYQHLRSPANRHDAGLARDIARTTTFSEFLETAPLFGHLPPRLDLYYRLSEHDPIPANLRRLAFDSLVADFEEHFGRFLTRGPRLGHVNASDRRIDLDMVYGTVEENICFERHRWIFDQGWFSRRPH